jgi:taurine dioxygenase
MTPAVGVEVTGVDLAQPQPEASLASLRMLLLRHGVLVFRAQSALTRAGQIAFARHFGVPEVLPRGDPDDPEIVRIEHGPDAPPTENIWHCDMSFRPAPPLGAVLRAIEVPEAGGDTLFADMRDVWARLPDSVRSTLRQLRATHDIAKWASPDLAETLRTAAPVHPHPVVAIHPETAEEILFVNVAYTTRLDRLSEADSDALLESLFREVAVPEVQCRVRWEPGTVVVWDNRSVQHYACGDYLPARRVMERVSLAGSPVGPAP